MGVSTHEDLFLEIFLDLFFRRSLDFGKKNALNFGEELFFGDHLVFTEQLPQSNSRLMKIRVKFEKSLCEILATRLCSQALFWLFKSSNLI